MSITKQQLKSIVKECLVEILSEGMGRSTGSMIYESSKKSHSQVRNAPPVHSSSILKQNASKTRIVSQNLSQAIKQEAGGNNVLADILADTAATTLPAMLENDSHRMQPQPTGIIERTIAASSPEQIFGEETTSKWAELAFMGQSVK